MKQEKSVFEEAAEEALKKNLEQDENNESKELEIRNKAMAMYISENPGKEFQKLKEAIEGPFAEKFMNIMNTLPDRDFMRYYLKALEYFKPKVTRVEPNSGGDEEDRVIQVNIMQVNKDGEITTLSVNSKQEENG
jgi:hypothetical protein